MLGRYQIQRGKRTAGNPLPDGIRQDTRKHTRHVLRPHTDQVQRYLERPSLAAWHRFAAAYRELLEERFAADAGPFEDLAELARRANVWIGCSCPTKNNPDVRRCHTYLALRFFADHFKDLEIDWPGARGASPV